MPTAKMSPTQSHAEAQTIRPATGVNVDSKDGEAQPRPGQSDPVIQADGSGHAENPAPSRPGQEPNGYGEKAGSPIVKAGKSQQVGEGSSGLTPSDPKIVPASSPFDPTLVGFQYPKDSADELKRIGAEIEGLRKPSIPAMQVYANEHRIRDLASRNYQIKEIYNQLVRSKRIDPDEVSYKQFADQVKIKKFRGSTA